MDSSTVAFASSVLLGVMFVVIPTALDRLGK